MPVISADLRDGDRAALLASAGTSFAVRMKKRMLMAFGAEMRGGRGGGGARRVEKHLSEAMGEAAAPSTNSSCCLDLLHGVWQLPVTQSFRLYINIKFKNTFLLKLQAIITH